MTEEKASTVSKLIGELKHQRDELRLKIHLGGEELKDEWEKLDRKLTELNDRYQPLKDAVEESAEDVWDSLKLVGSEIKDGFNRIRKEL